MTAPMIDHAPRILAQQRQAAELEAINELETRGAPLIWLVYAAAFAAVLSMAIDGWQRHEAMAIRYASMAAANEALVKCIKGQAIGMGDAVMRCSVREYKLLKPSGGKS